MKHGFLSVTLVLLLATVFCRAEEPVAVTGGAHIVFEKTAIDFGWFKDDEVQEGTFLFRNDGDQPLVLLRVYSDCNCTVASYPKDGIPPGGQGEIVVKFDGKGRVPGGFKKLVNVRSNATNKLVRITVQGKIKKK